MNIRMFLQFDISILIAEENFSLIYNSLKASCGKWESCWLLGLKQEMALSLLLIPNIPGFYEDVNGQRPGLHAEESYKRVT